jgi:hypothetical protein
MKRVLLLMLVIGCGVESVKSGESRQAVIDIHGEPTAKISNQRSALYQPQSPECRQSAIDEVYIYRRRFSRSLLVYMSKGRVVCSESGWLTGSVNEGGAKDERASRTSSP